MSFEDKSQRYLEAGYGLGRGYAPSLRLNFQYDLLRSLLGYTIQPEIQGKLPPDAKIADVGTGTGKWLIDVSRELPSSRLDGFDISEDQYPNKAWIPSNISFSQLDITEPVPRNLEGLYDVVHVQLFLFVVKQDGPANILKELYKMLKPGGYLQWVEYDPVSFKIVSVDPSLKQSETAKFLEIIRGPEGQTTGWPSKLPSYLEDAGFEQITCKHYPLPPELYAPFMQSHLCAAEEISLTAMKNDGPEAQGALFRKLLAEVHQECQKGVTITTSPIVVAGQKPVGALDKSLDAPGDVLELLLRPNSLPVDII